MNIRKYTRQDQLAVLELFDANCPRYFAPQERKDLENYLEYELEDYFVVEIDGKPVACGGINLREEQSKGVLSWDMIHPDYQKRGIGKALVAFRIRHLEEVYRVEKIGVRTSQFTDRFYVKCGFELKNVVKDYWAKGYDLYDMSYQKINRGE